MKGHKGHQGSMHKKGHKVSMHLGEIAIAIVASVLIHAGLFDLFSHGQESPRVIEKEIFLDLEFSLAPPPPPEPELPKPKEPPPEPKEPPPKPPPKPDLPKPKEPPPEPKTEPELKPAPNDLPVPRPPEPEPRPEPEPEPPPPEPEPEPPPPEPEPEPEPLPSPRAPRPPQQNKPQPRPPQQNKPRPRPPQQNEVDQYFKAVHSLIDKTKRYPKQALRRRLQGKIILRLRIDKDGRLLDVEVMEAASKIFLKPSLEAVRKSAPFPSFPKDWTVPSIALDVPLHYRLR